MTAIEQGSLIPHTNMANTLRTPHVKKVLTRLFAAAAQDREAPRWRTPGISWETATALERADASAPTDMPSTEYGEAFSQSPTLRLSACSALARQRKSTLR